MSLEKEHTFKTPRCYLFLNLFQGFYLAVHVPLAYELSLCNCVGRENSLVIFCKHAGDA